MAYVSVCQQTSACLSVSSHVPRIYMFVYIAYFSVCQHTSPFLSVSSHVPRIYMYVYI